MATSATLSLSNAGTLSATPSVSARVARPSAAPSLNVTSVKPAPASGPGTGQNFLAQARRSMFEAERNIVKSHDDLKKVQTDSSVLNNIQSVLSQLTDFLKTSQAKLEAARVNHIDVSEALLDLQSLKDDQKCLQTRVNMVMRNQKPQAASSPQQSASPPLSASKRRRLRAAKQKAKAGAPTPSAGAGPKKKATEPDFSLLTPALATRIKELAGKLEKDQGGLAGARRQALVLSCLLQSCPVPKSHPGLQALNKTFGPLCNAIFSDDPITQAAGILMLKEINRS